MKRIYVVDDDPWTIHGICSALDNESDLTVCGNATSGEDAVAHALSTNPDLILMDISMPPGLSGIDATTRILKESPTTRIAILTTLALGPGLHRAMQSGALAVIRKTIPPQDLSEAVRSIINDEPASYIATMVRDMVSSGDLGDYNVPAPQLTARERQILTLICRGLTYQQIASSEHISEKTARVHGQRLREKLNAHSVGQLIAKALEYKFYIPE